jgi:16S rRNA (uracil1498-N3)-methyltransferase
MRNLTRFYWSGENLGEGKHLSLQGEAHHKLAHVLRAKIGDGVLLFNGQDGEWQAQVTALEKRSVCVEILKQVRSSERDPSLGLAFCLIKPSPLEWMLEKATELGVTDIYPLVSDRTVVRHLKVDKLHILLKESTEQCGRLQPPTLYPVQSLAGFLQQRPSPLGWAYEGRTAPLMRDFPQKDHALPTVWLIGPEGGFSESEVDSLRQSSAVHPVTLGPHILRAETAAVAALAQAVAWR